MIGYKFTQYKQWDGVHQTLQKLNADIASATKFVREIERGRLIKRQKPYLNRAPERIGL